MADPHFLEILETVENGGNTLIIGSGGVGKSVLIRVIAAHMEKNRNKCVFLTATTGVAALNIKGSTFHRWVGIGLGQGSVETLTCKVIDNFKASSRIKDCDILVIDEISMFGYNLIEKMDRLFKIIRNEFAKPFGGIQVIFSGDFLQLPPVKDDWAFKSQAWKHLCLVPFILSQPKRYTNRVFFEMLQRIREGKQTSEDIKKLRERAIAYKKLIEEEDNNTNDITYTCSICLEDFTKDNNIHTTKCGHNFHESCISSWTIENTLSRCPLCRDLLKVKPTILYSKKLDVSKYNMKELLKCPGPTIFFHSKDVIRFPTQSLPRDIITAYKKILEDTIPSIISLRVGAQVMLRINLCVEQELVNGSRGVVTEIVKNNIEEYVMVKFLNGQQVKITSYIWDNCNTDNDIYYSRTQIPLILAYAITIHRIQGSTIDSVICDIGPSIFTAGQAYVALSRVRNLEGLYLSNFLPSSISVDETALTYYKEQIEIQNKREILEYEDENGELIDSDTILDLYIRKFKITI